MKRAITTLFQGLKPLEISEYLLFGLTLLLLPWSWSLALAALLLLVANTVARLVTGRRIGNPHLGHQARWAFGLLMAFYLYQIVTLVYSANQSFGWNLLWHRLPLLVLPLGCMLVDTSYFSQRHKRVLLGLFTGSLVLKFMVRFVIMLATQHRVVLSSGFDPLHHTYMALYILMAIGFLYAEWSRIRKQLAAAVQWLMALVLLVLVTYLVMIQSRTGIVGLLLMVVAVIVHQLFVEHNLRLGLSMLCTALLLGGAVFFLLPEGNRRLTKTLTEATHGDTSDARFQISHGAMTAIGAHMPFGVGIGDGEDVLLAAFEANGYDYGVTQEFNSHNAFLDVLLTMGLPGLLLLLAFLGVPAWWALKQRNLLLLTFLFTLVVGALFEAILTRQMGILYCALFYTLLIPSLGHCSACEPDPHKD